jgi:hypothetical protein
MLGLMVMVELFVGRNGLSFMDSAELDWMSSGRAARRKADRFDILAFGDSMLKFGIAPRVLEAKLGRKAYNLALLDGKPSITYILFRRAIEAGARPSAVLIDHSPEGLNQPPWHLLTNPHWNALLLSPREAWELARAYHDPEFFGHLVVARVLPSFRCRGQIRTDVLAALRGQGGSDPENHLPMRRNWQVNRGGILLPKQPGFQGDVPPGFAGDLFNDHCVVQPENVHFVRRMLRLAAENQVPVYWLMPPNAPKVVAHRDGNGVHANLDRFVRGLQTQFPNLSVIDARHAGYRNTVFVDPVHLDRDGAVALSADVAEVLRRSLIHSEPVARWVELPAYRDRPIALALEDVNQSRERLKLHRGGRRR